ncbi:MAG: choice-of-anchor J domain-containing protein [Salinivirgaceae bacterium]|nr:choice-of-anchor J domain-containing protein [Salinivirgaceae bacterium]
MKKITTLLLALSLSLTGFSQIIFEETFETGNTNATAPTGWTYSENPKWMAGNGEQSHNRSAHNGSWYTYFPFNSNSWMFREIELEANQTYEFSMWYKTDGSDGFQYEVKWGANPLETAMTNTLQPLTVINNTEYQQLVVTFVPTTNGTFHIGIHGISTNNPWYLCLDDIKLEAIADYNFELARINNDTIAYSGSSYDYFVAVKNRGLNSDVYTLASESEWDVEFYSTTGTEQITTLSLNSFITDTIIVRQFVPATGVELGQAISTMVNVNSQALGMTHSVEINTTAVSPITTFPYQQGFENTAKLPLGWNTKSINGTYAFEPIAVGSTPDCTPHDNSAGMVFYRSFMSHADNSAILSSPPVSFSNSEYIVRFWVYRTANIDNRADKIEIYISEDANLTTSTLLGTVHRATNFEPVETTEGWFEYHYVFTTPQSVQHIVFKAVSAYGWNMYIDDVTINSNLPDQTAPEFISITETEQYADLDMPLTVVIRDESQVTETMQGIYNVGNGEETFTMHLSRTSKGNFIYTGNIPAQPNSTSGIVKFVMSDILGNSDETDEFPISWNGVAPLLEESFEGHFPPTYWIVQGEPLTWFIWRQVGTEFYEDSDENSFTVVPKHGAKQAMVDWDFQGNNQNEWLISPEVEITAPAYLSFETFAHYGSMWYDHYTVGVSTNGFTWDVLWDAFYLNPMINQYDEKVTLSLDNYVGQTIRVAWRAYNTMYDHFWYAWFIDDVRIEKRGDVGIWDKDNSQGFDFTVMPNPVVNTLNINVKNTKSNRCQLHIYNTNGQRMKNETIFCNALTSENKAFDVSTFPAGIYVCHIDNGTTRVVKKFVVVK